MYCHPRRKNGESIETYSRSTWTGHVTARSEAACDLLTFNLLMLSQMQSLSRLCELSVQWPRIASRMSSATFGLLSAISP